MINPKPSIYAIENKANNKKYIGGATYPSQRWHEHKSALRLNRHRNQTLQEDWNKFGEQCFSFVILEETEKDLLSEREDYYIRKLKDLYNNLSGYAGRKRNKPKLPKNHKPVRPDIGEVFAKMLFECRDKINEDGTNRWSYTVANRRMILEAWKRTFPDKTPPKEALDMLKPFYKDLDF